MSGDVYTPRYGSSPASVDPGEHEEDTPNIPGSLGMLALAVRNDGAATPLTTANGNFSAIAVDEFGKVFVTTSPGSDRTATGTIGVPPGTGDVSISTQECSACGVKITGAPTGTWVLEGSIDGTNFDPVYATPPGPGATPVSSGTGNFDGTIECSGFALVRVRGNTLTSPATIWLDASTGAVGVMPGVWSSAKGAATALGVTAKSIAPNLNPLDVWDNTPQTHMSNYSCSRGDAPQPTWVSGTTMTWNGPTLASWQLRKVMVITNATTRPLVWEQGANAVLTISGTLITVTALDGTVAPLTAGAPTFIDVMWTAQDKAYDPSLQGNRNLPGYSDRSYRTSLTPTALVVAGTPVAFAAAPGTAMGPQIQVDGEKWLRLFIAWTVGSGTATTFQIKAFFSHTPGGTQYPLSVLKVDTSANPYVVSADDEVVNLTINNTSGLKTFLWDLNNCVGYVQFYAIASAPGSGVVANAEYTVGY